MRMGLENKGLVFPRTFREVGAMVSFVVIALAGLFATVGSDQTPNEFLQLIPAEAYWEHQKVEPDTQALLAMLREPGMPEDLQALLDQLGDASFRKRKAAQEALVSAGPVVLDQVKKLVDSPDSEVAGRAAEIVEKLTTQAARNQVRQLMAIRTLGRRKETKAAERLEVLAGSTKPFVAEYAAQALARIQGKPWKPQRELSPQLKKDLSAFPGELSVLGQVDFTNAENPMGIAEMVRSALGKQADAGEVSQVVATVMSGMIPVAHEIGNFRLDAVTFGLSLDVDSKKGWGAAILRGRYDPALVGPALLRSEPDVESRKVAGVDVLAVDSDFQLCLVSPEIMVVVSGPEGKDLPVEKVLLGVLGKQAYTRDKAMTQLLGRTDTASDFWIAMRVPPVLKEELFFQEIQQLCLSSQTQDKGRKLTLSAWSSSQDKAAKAAQDLRNAVSRVRGGLRSVPMEMGAITDLLGNVKVRQEESKVLADVLVTPQAERALLVLPLQFFAVRAPQ
jgi:hypothetical protein